MSFKTIIPPELHLAIETAANAVLKSLLADPPIGLPMRSRLLTVKETCVYLNSSRATLHRLEEAGVLLPKRFGRKVVYDRADLDAYIESGGVV
jgi:excisionase family DNA binding protein